MTRLAPRRLTLTPEAPVRAARRLSAFALEIGAPLSARARLATAVGELVQNAVDHAFEGEGEVTLEAWVEGNSILARVRDEGCGFDANGEATTQATSAFDGGLARVSCLVEDLQLATRPGAGTRATVRVFAASTRFDNDLSDMTDEDFLLPGESQRVLETLGDEDGPDAEQLPAHLAVCIGRLLAGPDPRSILRTTLGS